MGHTPGGADPPVGNWGVPVESEGSGHRPPTSTDCNALRIFGVESKIFFVLNVAIIPVALSKTGAIICVQHSLDLQKQKSLIFHVLIQIYYATPPETALFSKSRPF